MQKVYRFWNDKKSPILSVPFIVCFLFVEPSKTVITTSFPSNDLMFILTTSVGNTENRYSSLAERFIVSFFVIDPSLTNGLSKEFLSLVLLSNGLPRNQQPHPKGRGMLFLYRYLHSGFNTFFNRPEARTQKRAEGIKPLSTNKSSVTIPLILKTALP